MDVFKGGLWADDDQFWYLHQQHRFRVAFKMKPTVSVVIPFYNGSAWIERAIESVKQQSYPAHEFFVVNDGSTEEEALKLLELSKLYGFSVINQANTGQGGARNAGVEASTAEYICFLDQDDFFLKNHILDLVNAIPEDDPYFGYVYGDFCHADAHGNTINSESLMSSQPGQHPKRGHISLILSRDLMITPSSVLVRKDAFDAVGGFDSQFRGYEDEDLFIRLFRAGYSSHFLPKTVYVWCMHGDSTSWSATMSKSRIAFFKKMCSLFPDDEFNRIFYLRDCLKPRFESAFLRDLVVARLKRDKNSSLYAEIVDQYVKIIDASRSVKSRHKARLHLKSWLASHLPLFMFKRFRALKKYAT
ncbi:glycosyltransferase family 2 protein [Leptothrix sp. BB-4]